MNGIGLVRFKNPTTLEVSESKVSPIKGIETQFLKQFKAGDSIRIIPIRANEMFNVDFVIASVDSESQMTLKDQANEASFENRYKFKMMPKLSQTEAFSDAIGYIKEGGCLAIFPEGCSHDQPEPIPFKSGAAIIALKAAQMYDSKVWFVPVG